MKKTLIFVIFFFVTFLNVYAVGDYVTSIKIDGNEIEGFDVSKTDYKINVASSKENIVLGYVYDSAMYTGIGSSGSVNLNYGENKLSFTLKNKTDENDTKTYNISVTREDTRSSDNSLSSLIVGNNKVVLSNENEYTVSIDAKESKVEVKATLSNNKASFVDGFGERVGNNAVTLSGEVTSLNIKVKAENGSIRDYKINIKKTNFKNSDATLKSLTIEKVDFDFKSNVYEYNLSVKNDIIIIKLKAVPNDSKAIVDYKETVSLKNGLNEVIIKVTAEDGKVQEYKLNITREEEIPLVKDIKIKGIDFEFDPKIYNYKIETDLDKLDFNVTLNSETATSEIINNENLENNSVIKIEVKDEEETATYSFKIVKEVDEEKEEIETTGDDTDFFQKYEMIISLSILGVGILSLLLSILLKAKK